jgi:hypothetical protein
MAGPLGSQPRPHRVKTPSAETYPSPQCLPPHGVSVGSMGSRSADKAQVTAYRGRGRLGIPLQIDLVALT